jgi:general secretion pathway protein F
MTQFQYIAIRNDGERVTGSMEGRDRALVIGRLGEQGLHPVDVREQGEQIAAGRAFSLRSSAASFRDITIFTRELAWLLKAGMSLNQALDILSKDGSASAFGAIVATMRNDIRKGKNFHETLASTGVFSPYYISMVEVGEVSGTLANVLERIAQTRDKEQKVRGKLTSSLLYPALLTVLAFFAVIFIMTSVVPNIKDMILSSGAPVPESAQFVIGISDWLIANGQMAAIAAPIALLLLAMLARSKAVQDVLFAAVSHLPLIGPLLRKSAVLQFCRVLGALLSGGVSLPESLRLMRPTTGNRQVATVLGEMETALRKGDDFLVPIERSRFFPPLLARMLRVGHETGNLTPSVLQVTDILDEELDTSISRALTLLEPLIILVLSVIIAFIITSLMGAIISINDLAI